MLAAAHTKILMEMFDLAGCPKDSIISVPGSLMAFGNILPDSLPIMGITADMSHDAGHAAAVMEKSPAVGLGIMIHLWADNLTHCGTLENCGDYSSSFALDLGSKWSEASGGRFEDLLNRIEGKSRPYILHIIIEIAADVLSATDDVLDVLEGAWKSAHGSSSLLMSGIAPIYGMDPTALATGIKNYPPTERDSYRRVYSRPFRAGLFMRKFGPDLKDKGTFSDRERESVIEMIELGEEIVRDDLDHFLTDSARRIYEYNADVRKFLEERLKTLDLEP